MHRVCDWISGDGGVRTENRRLTHTTSAKVIHLDPPIAIAAAMMSGRAAEQHVRAPDAA